MEIPTTYSRPVEISVCVPVLNEESSIRALIDDLLSQTKTPFEIVICDTGSTDTTRTIIETFIETGAPVKLIPRDGGFPGLGRNVAAANAICDWIAFIDAGIRPQNNWLEALADQVVDPQNAQVVYGSYEPVTDSFFTECAAIAYVPPVTTTVAGPVRPYSIASALMLREAWKKAGGFPEHLRSAEDLIFMEKVEAAGFQIVRAPTAVVHWSIQPGLWKTFRRFVVYARNNIRAGLWRNWQATIFRRYGLIAILAVPAIFLGAKWLVVPGALFVGILIARAVRSIWLNRRCYPAGLLRNLLRLFVIVPILAVLDLAAFVGTAAWLFGDWRQD